MANITASNMCIEYPIFNSSHRSLTKKLISSATGGHLGSDVGKHLVVKALDNISFTIAQGERVAILGHNGSGKTTLLRSLAGVYYPTYGSLSVNGRISTLLDLAQGMDVEATGWENIYLRALTMGASLREIRNKVEQIAEFSELGEFLNMPARTYSSGMMLRLAFSVSMSLPRDIVLMDEWLTVGDASFAEKSAARLKTYLANASILVIATHSKELAKDVCNRVITLDHGKIVDDQTISNQDDF